MQIMKLLSYICALIVLVQVMMPCTDKIATTSLHKRTEFSIASSKNQDHKDSCTPFCQCTCCATPSIQQLAYIIVSPDPIVLESHNWHTPGKCLEVHINVWQPPKVIS